MKPFAVAGIQMHIGVENNIAHLQQRIDLTMQLYPWVQMVVLSELAAYGPSLAHAGKLGPTVQIFCEMAVKHKIWLLPGSLFEREDGVIYNSAPVINPQGELVVSHRKIFPFAPYEVGVTAGENCTVFDVPDVGRFGVLICYDMWFPETLRTLVSKGAEVILHPVLTHSIDRDIELNIARASAAMFQSYIFDINGLGAGGNGQSCVIDPAGRTLHQASVHDAIIPIEVDFDQVRRQRERGIMGLGQPVKSFRDRPIEFDVYNKAAWDSTYLDSLGALVKPDRAADD
jgi:predicted amidohydrolase